MADERYCIQSPRGRFDWVSGLSDCGAYGCDSRLCPRLGLLLINVQRLTTAMVVEVDEINKEFISHSSFAPSPLCTQLIQVLFCVDLKDTSLHTVFYPHPCMISQYSFQVLIQQFFWAPNESRVSFGLLKIVIFALFILLFNPFNLTHSQSI